MGSGGCNLEECAQEEGGGTESSQRSGVIPKADSGMQDVAVCFEGQTGCPERAEGWQGRGGKQVEGGKWKLEPRGLSGSSWDVLGMRD